MAVSHTLVALFINVPLLALPRAAAFVNLHDIRKIRSLPNPVRAASIDFETYEYLIEQAGVALVPGTAFGTPGHMRLSFATDMPTLERALERLSQVANR